MKKQGQQTDSNYYYYYKYNTADDTIQPTSKTATILVIRVFAKKVFKKNAFLPLKSVKSLPIIVLVFLRWKWIVQATPPKLKSEVGVCGKKAK